MIHTKYSQNIQTIWMSREPSNEMNEEFLLELTKAIEKTQEIPNTAGLVLRSHLEGFFSPGLDAGFLLELSGEQRAHVFSRLIQLSLALLRLKVPVIALIQGHALAGGAVLAGSADFRIMQKGPWRMGFTEAGVGLTIPSPLILLLKKFIHPHRITEATLLAKSYKPAEALDAGMVDELCENGEDCEKRIRKIIARVRSLPETSIGSIKENINQPLIDSLQELSNLKGSRWDAFFSSQEFEEGLRSVVENRRPNFRTGKL